MDINAHFVTRLDAEFEESGSSWIELRITEEAPASGKGQSGLCIFANGPEDAPRLRAYAEAIEAVNRRFDEAESAQEAAE